MEAKCEVCGHFKVNWIRCLNDGHEAVLRCASCAELWHCPTCNGGPNIWRVLSLELDGEGIPKGWDIGPDDVPPPGTMKYNRFGEMTGILQRYAEFRFCSLVHAGKDPSTDIYLSYFAPPEILQIQTKGFSSATDSMKQQIHDSFGPPAVAPRRVRVMSWNIQDLGGGPSRGPIRKQSSIDRIATVIAEVRPDICAILEVKLSGRKPSEPEKPVPVRETRNRSIGQLQQLNDERQKTYLKDFADYQRKLHEWTLSQKAGVPPGVLEVQRILTALQSLDPGGNWSLLLDSTLYTIGEAYAFLYRADAVRPTASGVLNAWDWPVIGYRHPARVTFELSGRCARPGPPDSNFELDVIAFHAPAPDHGQDVFDALARFKEIPWPRETVFAGDFNIDTEHGDIDHVQEYPSEFDPYETGFDEKLDAWSDLACNLRLDQARLAFEGFFAHVDNTLKSIFGDGLWLPGMDLERTSLRTSIAPAKAEHCESGIWTSTLAFQNAAYDKIVLLTPPSCNAKLLQAVNAYAYPLFERFLPQTLRQFFKIQLFDPDQILHYAGLLADSGTGSADIQIQTVLTEVKDVSDHVPVVLELDVHPK